MRHLKDVQRSSELPARLSGRLWTCTPEEAMAPLSHSGGSAGGFFFGFCFSARVDIFLYCCWTILTILCRNCACSLKSIAHVPLLYSLSYVPENAYLELTCHTSTSCSTNLHRDPTTHQAYCSLRILSQCCLNFDYYCIYVVWTFYRTLPGVRDPLPNSSVCAMPVAPCT